MEKAIAIFDIGKTNKKFFLFDHSFQVLEKEAIQFDETKDEDGYPCEDLERLVDWVQATFSKYYTLKSYQITHLNFSTYGASIVYLDEERNLIKPFYNYLKPVQSKYSKQFDSEYDLQQTSLESCSPNLELLNSGYQLFWYKRKDPEKFENVRHVMHFPQYLAYLFHHEIVADYTSIGCHTRLWDFQKSRYHRWTELENVRDVLPPPVYTNQLFHDKFQQGLMIGVGIHDSSAALIPYLKKSEEPFILLSTGTWNICLNPINNQALTLQDLEADCLVFLGPKANQVKASRAMLGAEHELQVNRLIRQFKNKPEDYWSLKFDRSRYERIVNESGNRIIKPHNIKNCELLKLLDLVLENPYDNFEDAYFFIIRSLIAIQLRSLELVNISSFKKLYIDGGFTDNEVFINALSYHLPSVAVIKSENPIGSALGAAQVMF
ncbi:MAG: FGGY family carbohydrate kinase [Cyclobacteriaceae bacterium]